METKSAKKNADTVLVATDDRARYRQSASAKPHAQKQTDSQATQTEGTESTTRADNNLLSQAGSIREHAHTHTHHNNFPKMDTKPHKYAHAHDRWHAHTMHAA